MFVMVRNENTLTPREREIARLVAAGDTNVKVAKTIGCHVNTVSRTLQRPAVRRHMQRLQDELDQEFVKRSAQTAMAAILFGPRAY